MVTMMILETRRFQFSLLQQHSSTVRQGKTFSQLQRQ
ncbi:uncharacterized protein CTRU02_204399 [Colletotrichum truncatum]|uniref:Uncharacterized protein n=10 Tax=Colletotrichum truncatum TaxID=5467 RepID=A0ACC3YWC2_COLTU